ncbi:F-box/RNI-like superfamily protein [Actinidia rufa]|uniref:F-box/RNI-like superfamily protein n=1 Tax=Actinidia rufa TaxID=165716 RepID=A0A7J0GUI9_9ERIC|nr:F-box/RNI-like superfamily protein [Actinidia rufa]
MVVCKIYWEVIGWTIEGRVGQRTLDPRATLGAKCANQNTINMIEKNKKPVEIKDFQIAIADKEDTTQKVLSAMMTRLTVTGLEGSQIEPLGTAAMAMVTLQTKEEVLSSSRFGWGGLEVGRVRFSSFSVGIGKRQWEGFVMSEGKQVILPLCPT